MMAVANTDNLIEQQAKEIEKLKQALRGCLSASKQTSPYFYSAALESIYREAHVALYGADAHTEPIDRPLATYMRNFDAELTQEEALQDGES